jgi:hypothetical protein
LLALPVCDGTKALMAPDAVVWPVPPLAIAVRPPTANALKVASSVPMTIQSPLSPSRILQVAGLVLVSIQGWKATVVAGALAPELWLNSAAKLSLMSARTAGNVAFCTVWSDDCAITMLSRILWRCSDTPFQS